MEDKLGVSIWGSTRQTSYGRAMPEEQRWEGRRNWHLATEQTTFIAKADDVTAVDRK
jgi:hypothetical protein